MHFEKYQGCAVSGVTKHNVRLWEGRGFERENIDNSLIGSNYSVGPNRPDPVGFVNARIGSLDLKRAPRKDAIRMVEWVATLPEGENNERGFFESLYRHMADEYGEENVIGAWVHKDEPRARPHMHFDFVPVTKDGRLSAKEIMSRAHLKTIHKRMQDLVSKDLGHEVKLLLPKEEKARKALAYLSDDEFKAAVDTKRAADEQAEEAKARLECLQHDAGELAAIVEPVHKAGVVELGKLAAQRGLGERERAAEEENRRLGERLRDLEGEKEGLERGVRGLEGEREGLRARVEALVNKWLDLGMAYIANVGEKAVRALSGLGIRAFESNPPLDVTMAEMTAAADISNASRRGHDVNHDLHSWRNNR